MRPNRIAACSRALAACALGVAVIALAGCSAGPGLEASGAATAGTDATGGATGATLAPGRTHAIVFVHETWSVATSPDPAATTITHNDWRIAGIDLATGDQTVLVEQTDARTEPWVPPALSPDGSQLLYGMPITSAREYPVRILGYPRDLQLHRLDLCTGEDVVACPQAVRSFGWDGDDIIATTWRDWTRVGTGASVGYMKPAHNAVLRISGSTVATIVPQADTLPDPDVRDDTALTGQLEFLGSDLGDLYFEEVPSSYGVGLASGASQHIWRMGSDESSPTIATSLVYAGVPGPKDEPGPFERLLDPPYANAYVGFLSNGLFPTHSWYMELVRDFSGSSSEETSHGVFVRRATDMEIVRTAGLEPADTNPPAYMRVLDAAVTRWLDLRELEPPAAPRAGTWLCETRLDSAQTTALVDISRDMPAAAPLGYVGPDLDALYISAQAHVPDDPGYSDRGPRTIFLWERTTAESRKLAELAPDHEGGYTSVVLVGSTKR